MPARDFFIQQVMVRLQQRTAIQFCNKFLSKVDTAKKVAPESEDR